MQTTGARREGHGIQAGHGIKIANLPGSLYSRSGSKSVQMIKSDGSVRITTTQEDRTMEAAASLTDTRDRLSEIVDSVATSGEAFTITKHGRPMAVILSYDEYESLIETLNVYSDADTMAAIEEARREALEDAEEGR
jgi:antitoxin YefM